MSSPSHIRFNDPENASGDASEDFSGVAARAGVMDYDGNESKNDFTSVVVASIRPPVLEHCNSIIQLITFVENFDNYCMFLMVVRLSYIVAYRWSFVPDCLVF
jgi:hypothetical protein